MTQQDREKLRSEFDNLIKKSGWNEHVKSLGERSKDEFIGAIVNFWLSKIDSAHTETLQKVEEIVEGEWEYLKNGINDLFPYLDSYELLPNPEMNRMIGQGQVMVEFNKMSDLFKRFLSAIRNIE